MQRMPNPGGNLPFYKTLWFLWLMLIILPPVGIILLWIFSRFKQNTRIILTVGFAIWAIILWPRGGTPVSLDAAANVPSATPYKVDVVATVTTDASQAVQPPSSTPTSTPTPTPTYSPTSTPGPTLKPTPAPTHTPIPSYNITIKFNAAKMISNDHVGNEWYYGVVIDGDEINRGGNKKLTLMDGDSFTVTCYAGENDSIPDEGSEQLDIDVNELKVGKNTFTSEVVVVENRGRYSGNTALWRFTITVTKAKK